jgi:hypothetical protein
VPITATAEPLRPGLWEITVTGAGKSRTYTIAERSEDRAAFDRIGMFQAEMANLGLVGEVGWRILWLPPRSDMGSYVGFPFKWPV